MIYKHKHKEVYIMHQLGMMYFEKESVLEKYTTTFLEQGVNPIILASTDEAIYKNNEIDSYLFYDEGNSFAVICEALISLKSTVTKPIWLLAKEVSKNIRLAYMELGAIVISTMFEDIDEFASFLNNVSFVDKSKVSDLKFGKDNYEKYLDQEVITLNEVNRSVIIKSEEYLLTGLEYQVIRLLLEKQGSVVTYEDFSEHIWKGIYTIDAVKYRTSNLIFLLRKKIPVLSSKVKTVFSKGYMLSE